ncbi:hypothetical protein [Aquimonas sp.]|jgi:hypothetical protein|uniref:hypothetical protein n=1 Tax=Aquimonas sp. TaxID=1872588 RepID=UPI0037C0AB68
MSETNHKTPAVGEEPIFTAAMYGSSQAAMQAQLEYLIEDREWLKRQLSEHKKNADRFKVVAGLFDHTKNSRCERVLDDLGLDGDSVSPFALIIDQHQGVTDLPSTDHWPSHLRALLDLLAEMEGSLRALLNEHDDGIAASDARVVLEQSQRWLQRASYQSEAPASCLKYVHIEGYGAIPGNAIVLTLDAAMQAALDNGANASSMPDEYVELAAWIASLDEKSRSSTNDGTARTGPRDEGSAINLTSKQILGLEGCREGSRSIGMSGVDTDDWEDYIEVPVGFLDRMARLISADLDFNAVEIAYTEARQAEGNYTPTDVQLPHPAALRLRKAILARQEALAPFVPSAKQPPS